MNTPTMTVCEHSNYTVLYIQTAIHADCHGNRDAAQCRLIFVLPHDVSNKTSASQERDINNKDTHHEM